MADLILAEDGEHSLFSASGAARWAGCVGSLAFTKDMVRASSSYADEGTAAHAVAKATLENRLVNGPIASAAAYMGQVITIRGVGYEVNDEMVRAVDEYADTCAIFARDCHTKLVEQRLQYHRLLGVAPEEGFGTGDFVAFNDRTIQVHDFKYGKGERVDAEGNDQMVLYAAGALDKYELVADFEEVIMAIHQPRIGHFDEWRLSVGELRERVDWLAQQAQQAKRLFVAGFRDEVDALEALTPSYKACRWCDGKVTCPARKAEVLATVASADSAKPADFADLTVAPKAEVQAYGANFLGHAFALADQIEDWIKAVRGEVERRVLGGQQVADPDGGFLKVVEGKKGNRAWANDVEAAAAAKRLGVSMIAPPPPPTPKSPAALEKEVGKAVFAANFAKLITRAPGPRSVARAADPRPPYEGAAKPDAFANLDAPPAQGAPRHPFRD